MEYLIKINYDFWPENDGEKWPRKVYFEIPPCAKLFSLHKSDVFCPKRQIQ